MEGLERQIKEAMGAHGCWKHRLQEAVSFGRLRDSAEDIARDDRCRFGKWLRDLQDDPEIRTSPEYTAVVAAHARFHEAAGHVAKCLENDRRDAASVLLNGADFQKISAALGKAMIEWRNSLQ
ncbi:CZB domain-containing protein [Phycobacter sp. K97]|uniref:CZB domain-containing protein n=1 Tax=Phycobacter sedimenti TaxID=3133977 RepID=UPI00311D41C6